MQRPAPQLFCSTGTSGNADKLVQSIQAAENVKRAKKFFCEGSVSCQKHVKTGPGRDGPRFLMKQPLQTWNTPNIIKSTVEAIANGRCKGTGNANRRERSLYQTEGSGFNWIIVRLKLDVPRYDTRQSQSYLNWMSRWKLGSLFSKGVTYNL